MLDFQPSATRLLSLLAPAAASDLGTRTPCARYVLGDLLAHLDGLTAAFRASADKEYGPLTDASPDAAAPVLEADWLAHIQAQVPLMVAAWQQPGAWEGVTKAGGVELPAALMGAVALNEITVHGWDLARALGQSYACDDATAAGCLTFVSMAAGQGGGPFGPPLPVADDYSPFDRLLALTGRNPAWSPSE